MIEFHCPGCKKKYRVVDDFAGKKAKCKQCEAAMQIPSIAMEPEIIEAVLAPPTQASAVRGAESSGVVQASPVAQPRAAASRPLTPPTPRPNLAGQPPSQASTEVLRGASPNFAYEISQRPDFALVTLRMEQGQKVFAEPSAMAAMTPTINLKAGLKGGFRKTLGRAFGGESVIINTLEAASGSGEVSFAPGIQGDVAHYTLNNNSLYLQRGAFLLHSEGVELTGKWQGAKGFFSGEGLVLLKASGSGDIFFNSYGAILAIDVADQYYVDTGYIVAFEDTLQYRVTVLPGLRAGGKIKSLFFGGEGLVCQFSGQGRVWIQTRHPQSFLSWVNPFRPTKRN
jgi:uncharacterized protein (TIGR00266 family)